MSYTPTFIYVVYAADYSAYDSWCGSPEAAFSSRELAEKYIENKKDGYNNYEIEELDLDAP